VAKNNYYFDKSLIFVDKCVNNLLEIKDLPINIFHIAPIYYFHTFTSSLTFYMALKSYLYHNLTEAGCDEAGRGCLAGPVYAAAVILPKNFRHPILNDSKKLSKRQRESLRDEIISQSVAWSVASVDNNDIDNMNILRASIKAMHLAISGLKKKPEFLLIDGNRFYKYETIGHKTIIRGDSLYFSIAAASVLAKTFRDDYMQKINEEYPQYGWDKNKGYATEFHRTAIMKFGITPYHRRSFTLYDQQLSIDF
jgi:ribonuclease HII